MSTSKYAFLSTPAILAGTMIADLGNGEETWNEDRTSSYIAIAQRGWRVCFNEGLRRPHRGKGEFAQRRLGLLPTRHQQCRRF